MRYVASRVRKLVFLAAFVGLMYRASILSRPSSKTICDQIVTDEGKCGLFRIVCIEVEGVERVDR